MTLEEARDTLNKNFHRVPNNEKTPNYWYIYNGELRNPEYYDWLEEFEAIAIAEKYERDERSPSRCATTH